MVYFGFTNQEARYTAEKEFLDEIISPVEPFVEALPQIYIMVCLFIFDGDCFGPVGPNPFLNIVWFLKIINSLFSFCTEVMNFFHNGPVRVVVPDSWKFPHVLVNCRNRLHLHLPVPIAFILTAFVAEFGAMMAINGGFDIQCSREMTLLIVISVQILPQIIFALSANFIGLGIKPIFKIMMKYPALVVILMLSGWTYASVDHEAKYLFSFKANTAIQLNQKLTIFNVCLMAIANLSIFVCIPNSGSKIISPDWMNKPYPLHAGVVAKLATGAIIVATLCKLFLMSLRSWHRLKLFFGLERILLEEKILEISEFKETHLGHQAKQATMETINF